MEPAPKALIIRALFSLLIAAPMLWIITTLELGVVWYLLLIAGIVISLLTSVLQTRLADNPLWLPALATICVVGVSAYVLIAVPWRVASLVMMLVTFGILFGLSYIYPRQDAGANIAMIVVGVLLAIVLSNVMAGVFLRGLEQAAQRPAEVAEPQEPDSVAEPEVEEAEATEEPTPEPTQEPTEEIEVEEEADPIAEQAQPGWGYQEFIEDGGEVSWNYLTGFGPRVNTVVRNYMVDAEGQFVYDTVVEYNEYGMRGPAVPYQKSDDVYRILIIGDSFVEAIQVDYEDTFPAQLQSMLTEEAESGQRFEVIAMGRTGWGTLHEYLYYHHEGHKFNADLVVLSFFINDVADNYPIFFYPGINNTNFEFVFADDTVQIVDTNQQPLPPNSTRILYNALPGFLQRTALARMIVRIGDPPIPVITPGTVLERVHPQYYIYVSEPEVEGYAEAWERTEAGIELLANEVEANGGQLVIMPIFLGSEQVQNVSNWWPELVEGWQWDDSLPEQQLADIAERTGADLAVTRTVYQAYADEVDGQVFTLLYLPEDGHFNPTGHALTAEALFNYLQEEGIILNTDS